MKRIIAATAVLFLLFSSPLLGQRTQSGHSSHARTSGYCCSKSTSDVHVRGYHKSNGAYVKPYARTRENNTQRDNFSTKGNVNPYTGRVGTKRTTH
jgi:hypothetical protein